MGKVKGLGSEDVHKRVNFLYQAAYQSLMKNPEDLSLCRFHINSLMVIARRQGIQLHPDMRRKLCKRCCVLLVPGVTAIYRVKKKRQKQTVVTCLACGTFRRYVYDRKNVPWIDKPEAWIDTIVSGQPVTIHQQKGGTDKGEGKKKGKGNQPKETVSAPNKQIEKSSDKDKISFTKDHNSGQSTFSKESDHNS